MNTKNTVTIYSNIPQKGFVENKGISRVFDFYVSSTLLWKKKKHTDKNCA